MNDFARMEKVALGDAVAGIIVIKSPLVRPMIILNFSIDKNLKS